MRCGFPTTVKPGASSVTNVRAMVFTGVGRPLQETELATPSPGPGQVRLEVSTCGVCRTDLHIVDGELAEPKLPAAFRSR